MSLFPHANANDHKAQPQQRTRYLTARLRPWKLPLFTSPLSQRTCTGVPNGSTRTASSGDAVAEAVAVLGAAEEAVATEAVLGAVVVEAYQNEMIE